MDSLEKSVEVQKMVVRARSEKEWCPETTVFEPDEVQNDGIQKICSAHLFLGEHPTRSCTQSCQSKGRIRGRNNKLLTLEVSLVAVSRRTSHNPQQRETVERKVK